MPWPNSTGGAALKWRWLKPVLWKFTCLWRAEVGQYSGYLHAGLIGTLIDTACGFAAATVAGPHLLAAHFSVNCLRPAVGQKFVARARVVKPGKTQIFTSCDLFAVDAEGEKLVANGQTLLAVMAA